MTDTRKKAMHINLHGAQVDDYDLCRTYTGITNDNDLIRHLLREKANSIRSLPLFASRQPTQAEP